MAGGTPRGITQRFNKEDSQVSKQKFYQLSPLCSPLVTITVGPERVPFQVHKDVVTKTKYFRSCLDGKFTEAATNELHLPEDDPIVFAKIVDYIYFGVVPYTVDSTMIPPKGATEIAKALAQQTAKAARANMIQIYASADKFCIEGLMNAIQDRYRKINTRWTVTADELNALTACGRPDSPMRRHALATVAWEMRAHGWERFKEVQPWIWNQYLAKDKNNVIELFEVFVDNSKQPYPFEENGDCKWHVHIDTPKCPG